MGAHDGQPEGDVAAGGVIVVVDRVVGGFAADSKEVEHGEEGLAVGRKGGDGCGRQRRERGELRGVVVANWQHRQRRHRSGGRGGGCRREAETGRGQLRVPLGGGHGGDGDDQLGIEDRGVDPKRVLILQAEDLAHRAVE